MGPRIGTCTNFADCRSARQGQQVHVPRGQDFICPECRQTLRPRSGLPLRRVLQLGIPAGLGLGLLVIIALAQGKKLTPAPPPEPPVQEEPAPPPPDPSPAAARARELVAEGETLMSRGHTDEGREAFREATKLDPANAFAWANLGGAEMLRNRTAEALVAYQRALDADPNHWSAHYNLACYHARQQDLESALEHLHRALQALRAQPDTQLLANVLHDLQQNPDFEELRRDPRFSSLLAGGSP